jgi:hypothetical protein
VTSRKTPVPRASHLEAWGLFLALGVLLALGVALGVARLSRGPSISSEADAGPGNPSVAYRAEEAVDAWHAGRWYPARVHSVSADRYFITYDDFSISWHEWVTAHRLRKR